MKTKRNKIEKGDTMIYEEKRFMAVSEIEKECCTGCCFYDNGNCQLENPNCFNSGIIWVQKEDYMSEISEKAIKLAIEAMRPIPVYSSPCYSVIDITRDITSNINIINFIDTYIIICYKNTIYIVYNNIPF